ncbi:MAG: signal transduction protein [Pseudomonadota bacterium]
MKTVLATALSASLAIMLALPGVGPATAQEPGAAALARLDTNGDGAISREEAAAGRERMFKRIDRNGDGVADASEIEGFRNRIAALSRMADSMITLRSQGMDTDGDGVLTAAEFAAGGLLFDLADRNGDGLVTQAEMAAMRALRQGARP